MALKTYTDRSGVTRVVDGSPYYVHDLKEHYDICCDCGLTHKTKFRIEDSNGDPVKGSRLKVWTWTDKKLTAENRSKIEVKFVTKRGRSAGGR
jgi:hypothetical protein